MMHCWCWMSFVLGLVLQTQREDNAAAGLAVYPPPGSTGNAQLLRQEVRHGRRLLQKHLQNRHHST